MNIAVIPARGGSKRIPNKNIKDFCGKPIIAYSIETALQSDIFDRVIVSTDSIEIREVSLKFNAEVPSLRPSNISDDNSTTLDVISYEVSNLGLESNDIVCCIYPTSPLLKIDFLKEAYFRLKEGSYCFSACEFNSNPLRSFYIKNEKLCLLNENFTSYRSQDLETFYYDAGQFYFGYASSFLNKKPIFSVDSSVVILPQINVVDINTQEDWEIAEIKYKILCKQ
ncbi:pseudaminic acid cytidylyltransferase [Helicobacter sp. MIT 14-3879]|uniref:pseudaminic acid cytidylyltransferase n=1 Tax=Helicobacter sp. MIT 14-3879 TaxID=2040649 RepID=UPI000E1E4240|nr:pseudaminic acid cytidylyltransferase [Helicobacter sp. MIT 14-3879]RDU65105.1 pseudaminic acid cytidylyltransferase [Helicobacter sp. MIT 14-3879]